MMFEFKLVYEPDTVKIVNSSHSSESLYIVSIDKGVMLDVTNLG